MCIHEIDRSCGQLQDINIDYITQSTSQLRCLRLVCCYYITNEKLNEVAAKLPLLEELDMTISSLSKEPLEASFWVLLSSFEITKMEPAVAVVSRVMRSMMMMACRPYLMAVLVRF
ncbi:hypothetical protein SO802_006896 [Lithocarpus litseifolius]|uniref:Uncharacterized protein n=1 Tax=Lithocarpus litseifolius TaxID=425828 RepID=A0AAW2DQC7_9ROSI